MNDEKTISFPDGGMVASDGRMAGSHASKETPFDKLSLMALLFLSDRTNFNEPFAGFGFATLMEKEIKSALERKKRGSIR